MNDQSTPAGQVCPNCGATNSPLSIFCAECGASLDGSDTDIDHENVGQATVSFNPVSDQSDRKPAEWDRLADSQTTQLFTPQHADVIAAGDPLTSAWEPNEEYPTSYMQRPRESRRGFVLGLIATLLIVVVIGFFIWSSVVSEGFRDSVIGFF